jgi:allophanate hydrolase subunit 2
MDMPLFRLGVARPRTGHNLVVEVTDGPDYDEFGESANLLFSSEYTVSPRSNHIGLRLGGELPERTTTGEVLSRGVPVGAIEVPSREELLVLHRGRGVTAGYPVLAVATSLGLDVLAQARPGDKVRFRRTTVAEATAAYRRSMQQLETLRDSVSAVFSLLGIGGPAHWHELPAAACG